MQHTVELYSFNSDVFAFHTDFGRIHPSHLRYEFLLVTSMGSKSSKMSKCSFEHHKVGKSKN